MQKKRNASVNIFIFLFVISLIFLGCNSRDFIREMKPLDRADIEVKNGRGLLRSLFANVYAEELKIEHFHKLLKIKYFRQKSKNMTYRRPPVEMFFCIVKNTWKFPVTLQSVDLSYNKKTVKNLSEKDFLKRFSSPLYTSINIKRLFKPHRFINKKYTIDSFIKGIDVIPYEFNFIAPGDAIAYVFMFPRLSVNVRRIHLNIHLKSLNRKKKIDFEFTPLEYRSKGKDFIKKESKGLLE